MVSYDPAVATDAAAPADPGIAPEAADLALFLHRLGGGGAQRVMLDVAGGFAARGLAVDLLVLHGGGRLEDAVPPGVRLVRLLSAGASSPLPRGRRQFYKAAGKLYFAASLVAKSVLLWRYLARRRPRAMLSTQPSANVLALLAKLRFGAALPVAVRRANHYSLEFPHVRANTRWQLWLERRLWRLADAVVVNSRDLAVDLLRLDPRLRPKLHTIRNPVVPGDTAARAAAPAGHPWFEPGRPPAVLAVGRLVPAKDHATLLRAFAIASTARPLRLVLLGEGRERAELLRLAEALGIAGSVEFPGFVPDPFPYMARAGVFVLSSTREGSSNALVQALACGAPVVSTDCPGSAEALDGGRLGALVPVGDHRAMARAILRALARPGDSGLRIRAARSRYDAEANIERYLALLRSINGGARPLPGPAGTPPRKSPPRSA